MRDTVAYLRWLAKIRGKLDEGFQQNKENFDRQYKGIQIIIFKNGHLKKIDKSVFNFNKEIQVLESRNKLVV